MPPVVPGSPNPVEQAPAAQDDRRPDADSGRTVRADHHAAARCRAAAVASNQGILITTTAHFVPELGQSLATAQQQNINKLAREIVQLMEKPW